MFPFMENVSRSGTVSYLKRSFTLGLLYSSVRGSSIAFRLTRPREGRKGENRYSSKSYFRGGHPNNQLSFRGTPALGMEKSSNAASRSEQSSALVEVDPGEVHVCDLRGKGLQVEDLENALRLWRQPVVLMAGRNWLNRLPTNTPSSIMYLDISTNK